MYLTDLVFIAGVVCAIVGLCLRAWRRTAIGIALYFAVVILVSAVSPRRELTAGKAECFDDWCATVEKFERTPTGYSATLRLSSRAKRAEQRENNLAVYVEDAAGRRYDSEAEPSNVPFNVLLQPGESVTATRIFPVPPDVQNAGLVITHKGGFPIGWLIIGYDTWFRKPPVLSRPQ